MTAPIEVLEVRRVDGHGNLRAFANRLGYVVIQGVRVIREPQARQAERGRAAAEAIDDRAAAWSKGQRDSHVAELARRFDERGPDSVDDL